jgi:hypothetical protein
MLQIIFIECDFIHRFISSTTVIGTQRGHVLTESDISTVPTKVVLVKRLWDLLPPRPP